MHREIMGVTTPTILIDHIDRNGLNNQKSNLSHVTVRRNGHNRKDKRYSKYTGVTFNRGYFVAQIEINKKRIHLGRSKDEIVAAQLYIEAFNKIESAA